MIYKTLLFAILLSPTTAGGTVRKQDTGGLGSKYLQTVNTTPDDTPQTSRDGSMSAEVMGEFMAALSQDMLDSCIALGRVEYESSYMDVSTGEVQSYGITCRFQTIEAYDEAFATMRDAIAAAMPISTSFSSNINSYYSGAGQRQGLEMLLQMAQTLEEVMLIVPTYLSYSYPYQTSSSININLNKAYVYEDHPSSSPGPRDSSTSSPSPSMA